ncbi:MAG TPA: sucrase ferredoxin [Nocardioidaceae bacterium]|nr:sucrase ferredoxin [Nocardioidaceae bacterium]
MTDAACSDQSAAVHEPMAGTAPYALAWVALEQNGPWGARAFTQSHLDPEVGRVIEDTAAQHDVRPALIRRPGRHADPPDRDAPRHVIVAYTYPGRTWLLEGLLADPADLLRLDWAALRDGDQDAVRRSMPTLLPSERPHLLVCTNAKRDVCCAVKGRPVALGAAAVHPDRVWEVTHTSGHRFAPTAVLLPAGTLHGRLDVAGAGELLRAAERGATLIEGSRGRSTWPAAAQAADLAVREEEGVLDLDALEVVSHDPVGEGTWLTGLRHSDGRAWHVTVEARESEDLVRAESCGKALKPMAWFARVTDTAD